MTESKHNLSSLPRGHQSPSQTPPFPTLLVRINYPPAHRCTLACWDTHHYGLSSISSLPRYTLGAFLWLHGPLIQNSEHVNSKCWRQVWAELLLDGSSQGATSQDEKRQKGMWVPLGGSESRPVVSSTRAAGLAGSWTWPRRKAMHRLPQMLRQLLETYLHSHARTWDQGTANPLTAGPKSSSYIHRQVPAEYTYGLTTPSQNPGVQTGI